MGRAGNWRNDGGGGGEKRTRGKVSDFHPEFKSVVLHRMTVPGAASITGSCAWNSVLI